MVNIRIHRGSHCIGGSITEIYTENTHIFIDFGSELNADPDNSTDAKMIDMITHSYCDAVLFTHYHGDHMGLLEYIPEKNQNGKIIELRMGGVAKEVLINIHKALMKFSDGGDEYIGRHQRYLDILKNEKRTVTFTDNNTFEIGDFRITPIMVDHSAYDAYMFVIEAEGKIIVHTGDYRTHGRLGSGFFKKLEKILNGISVDVLITEGTMMSRFDEIVITETQLQQKATELLSKPENKYAFLICSSTNVESLASFANAAMKNGKAFYVNYYVYDQIQLYRDVIKDHRFGFKKTYKFESVNRYNPKLGMTQPQYMEENGFLMLIGTSEAYKKRIDMFKKYDPLLIYSMWNGYLEKSKSYYDKDLGNLFYGWPENRRELGYHTSGHATPKDIKKMIQTVDPKKSIIPIHTEHPEKFEELGLEKYSFIKAEDNEIICLG